MPSTTTDRVASCRARSLPLSSIAQSTPPPDQSRTVAPAPPATVASTTSTAPIARAASSRRGTVSTATTSAPASVASRVASRPMTPWPKTATRSPSRTSPASTALRAMEPTRANVPDSASCPVQVRQRTASAATTASLRWPQMPCTTSPTAGPPASGTPSATSTTSPTSE